MPVLRPLRALRYGLDRRDRLGALVTPARADEPPDPLSVRQLVRGESGPLAADDEPPFTHARRLLERWKEDGIVVRDPRPALYVYEQRLGDLVRRGVVGLVRLEADGRPGLLPHEQARGGSTETLQRQLDVIGCQLSMALAVVPDAEGALQRYLDGHPGSEYVEVTDGDGVINRLWVDEDPDGHIALARALRPEVGVIADGHHRVDAAVRHRAARGSASSTRERPCDYVMALLVPAADPGLRSQPTHRVCERLGDAGRAVLAGLDDRFARVPLAPGGEDAFLAERDGLRYVLVERERTTGLLLRPDAPSAQAALAALPAALRAVEPAALAPLLLDPLRAADAGPGDAGGAPSGSTFSHNRASASEVAGLARSGAVAAAILLRPVPVGAVLDAARAGALMPPKSTNFQPKPIKGLLMNPLGSF